jgi:dCTP deaminase
MTVLADWQIRARCEGSNMVYPFNPDLVNPASLDVRLGRHIRIESAESRELVLFDLEDFTQADPYLMRPGQFLLAETMETFNLPSDIAVQFMLKSSRAREGLEHLMAGYCDPGWHGSKLTMELHNSRQLQPVSIWPGMKIGQMVFHKMDQQPMRSYALTGRYNMQPIVTESLG